MHNGISFDEAAHILRRVCLCNQSETPSIDLIQECFILFLAKGISGPFIRTAVNFPIFKLLRVSLLGYNESFIPLLLEVNLQGSAGSM